MSKLGQEPRVFTAWLVRRDTDTVSLQPGGVLRETPEELGGGAVPAGCSRQERLHGSLRPQERLSINTSGFSLRATCPVLSEPQNT